MDVNVVVLRATPLDTVQRYSGIPATRYPGTPVPSRVESEQCHPNTIPSTIGTIDQDSTLSAGQLIPRQRTAALHCGRKRQPETGAVAHLALDFDRPIVVFHDAQ